MMGVAIREMIPVDYEPVFTLWQSCDGLGLSTQDTEEGIVQFLERNPHLSFVAHIDSDIIGAILCGYDGRRGYIHHLAVRHRYRRRGVASLLVNRCLQKLKEIGIPKCHLFVFADNQPAIAFWQKIEWTERVDLVMMSKYT